MVQLIFQSSHRSLLLNSILVSLASGQNAIQIAANGSNNYHYGVYFCIMDATGMEFTKTLFLRNKGRSYCIAMSLYGNNV